MIEKITWPVVAVIALVLGTIVGLAAMDIDLAAIGQLFTLLGLGGVFGVAMGIRDHVNGNTKEQLRMLADLSDKLSKAPAIVETPPEDPKP
jgi:hypothetical protein